MKRLALLSLCSLAILTGTALAERNYLAWQQRAGSDIGSTYRAVATTVTERGHVAVAGYNDLLQNDTWLVVCYDALTGKVRWSNSKSNAFGDVRPAAVVADSDGNVYVGGFTPGNSRDFLVIKYGADDGLEKWTRTYNNASSNGSDEITAMAVDAQDNIIVTGGSYHNGSEDFYTIKYDAAGSVAWEKRYGTSFLDRPVAIAVGPQLEVVVVGRSRSFDLSCYATVEYDASGNQQPVLNYDTVNDDIPSDVAIDDSGNIYVTGTARIASVPKYVVHTVKYGTNPWVKTYDAPGENSDWAPEIGIGPDNMPIMACTARLDSFRTVYRAAKYDANNGAELWSKDTSLLTGRPANSMTDTLADMAVDDAGNAVITGKTVTPSGGTDYLTVKFSRIDGRILWQQQLNGDSSVGGDSAAAIALSMGGDVVVTGTMDRGDQNSYFHIGTVRYNRMALSKGDPVTGTGLTSAAVVNSLGSPSIGYDGLFAKVTVKDGSKVLNGILSTAGGNHVDVLQGQAAPGVTNAKFATFSDPVAASDEYAFTATLSGAPTGQTSSLWFRTSVNGPVLIMQTGKQAPGLPSGVLVASIVNFDTVATGIVAQVTLKGTGVTTGTNSAAIRWSYSTGSHLIMRTGTSVTLDGKTSNVKSLGIFSPPAGSGGHGRYTSYAETTMKLTLVDGRSVITVVQPTANTYFKAASGGPADVVVGGGKWQSFTQPGIGYNGGRCVLHGFLKTGIAGVTLGTDSAIVYANASQDSYQLLVREGAAAKDITGATYTGFSPPVSNGSYFAFKGTVKGTGITTANNTGIWKGNTAANLALLVRTGQPAPDAYGADTTRQFASFTSIAFPVFYTGGYPIIRATLRGTGVTTANNTALFAGDREGYLRQILRTGDKLGTLTIKSFSVLNPVSKAMNSSRSFNNFNQITALITFTNLTQSIVRIDMP